MALVKVFGVETLKELNNYGGTGTNGAHSRFEEFEERIFISTFLKKFSAVFK